MPNFFVVLNFRLEIKYDEEVLTLREKFEIKDRIPKFIVYHLIKSNKLNPQVNKIPNS